jgi:hypothetical protein
MEKYFRILERQNTPLTPMFRSDTRVPDATQHQSVVPATSTVTTAVVLQDTVLLRVSFKAISKDVCRVQMLLTCKHCPCYQCMRQEAVTVSRKCSSLYRPYQLRRGLRKKARSVRTSKGKSVRKAKNKSYRNNLRTCPAHSVCREQCGHCLALQSYKTPSVSNQLNDYQL